MITGHANTHDKHWNKSVSISIGQPLAEELSHMQYNQNPFAKNA
jgi:hypothetical protein